MHEQKQNEFITSFFKVIITRTIQHGGLYTSHVSLVKPKGQCHWFYM